MPQILQTSRALDYYWEEAVYTYVALAAHPETKHLAEQWLLTVEEIEICWKGQRLCWREELAAQAMIVFVNYALDSATEEFSADKLSELRKKNRGWREREARESPEYKLYLKEHRLFELIKMGLENQINEMESWPLKVEQEESPELKEYAGRFLTLLTQGKAALKAKDDADASTATHRVRDINKLVEHLNQERDALYILLSTLALQNKEPKTWPDAFYRVSAPHTPNRDEARGKALAILGVLSSLGLEAKEEQQKKILSTTETQVLDAWISRVAKIQSVDELIA